MPFTRYCNKDEPPYLAARLVGFGSIQLRLQGNVAIPAAKVRIFCRIIVIVSRFLHWILSNRKIIPCLTTGDDLHAILITK